MVVWWFCKVLKNGTVHVYTTCLKTSPDALKLSNSLEVQVVQVISVSASVAFGIHSPDSKGFWLRHQVFEKKRRRRRKKDCENT